MSKKVHPNKLVRAKAGMLFGKLILIRRVRSPKGVYGSTWQVQCTCASQKIFNVKEQYLFRKPNPKRCCGCTNKGLPTLHPREYNVWVSMNNRCLRPDHVSWEHYGGRGITVCDAWHRNHPEGQSHAFANFLRDMGKRPENTTIDRYPDVNGNYEKSNCRWATPKMQAGNTRAAAIRKHFANKLRTESTDSGDREATGGEEDPSGSTPVA